MAAKTTRMIRTILLIAASCLAWLGAGAQQYEGAHLKFESSFHNFGSVPRRGGDLVWEFEYTNDGSAPLVIVRAQTTCSCLVDAAVEAARKARFSSSESLMQTGTITYVFTLE